MCHLSVTAPLLCTVQLLGCLGHPRSWIPKPPSPQSLTPSHGHSPETWGPSYTQQLISSTRFQDPINHSVRQLLQSNWARSPSIISPREVGARKHFRNPSSAGFVPLPNTATPKALFLEHTQQNSKHGPAVIKCQVSVSGNYMQRKQCSLIVRK